ncbi:hypothetical protein EW146_g5868 [Bondarzewia mesenterica]|uniref:Uncharacterized protein n=1 Tax=Bondarzewia mesenterica TaxID=1095465 RepID=A0A4S4LQT6_9AGAM|nr:hypothetical protein EW146_g5868 [Bondarzewia mesenterica]
MPVSSKTQKAEAKYNVTTEFPHLGLHSAAATGNIGLVKYALSHGQPINSVLDGVLPLHAACSGGNELVVKLLIESGADVNAPRCTIFPVSLLSQEHVFGERALQFYYRERNACVSGTGILLPRKYSSEKSRITSAPIVGSSGSTPLHFAAANGHTAVVLTLLQHGARADRADKHGVTPEMVARQNGWIGCADAILNWIANKDRDLRERETLLGSIPLDEPDVDPRTGGERHGSFSACDSSEFTSMRKRLHVKHSIDNAMNLFKTSGHATPSSTHEPSSPAMDALGQESPGTPDSYDSPLPPRRPSLSHATEDTISLHSRRSPFSSNVSSKARRPSSAGTGAESSRGGPRKLGSKYSLLHLFKKPSTDALSVESQSQSRDTNGAHGTAPSSNAASPLSASPSPASFIEAPDSPRRTRQRMVSDAEQTEVHASGSPPTRPGFLQAKGHARSTSSGQQIPGVGAASAQRAQRIDSSSSYTLASTASPRMRNISPSPGRGVEGFDDDEVMEEDEDEEYGQPIPSRMGLMPVVRTEGLRPRGQSQTSQLSPSPNYDRESADARVSVDFPFSIHQPPPVDDEPASPTHQPGDMSPPPPIGDGRMRGDSLSSATFSVGSTTGTSTSGGVPTTPALVQTILPGPAIASPGLAPQEIEFPAGGEEALSQGKDKDKAVTSLHGLGLTVSGASTPSRRMRIPLNMDIRAISSHAQAEALVQQTHQSILELEHVSVDDPKSASLPLSARGREGGAGIRNSIGMERRASESASLGLGLGGEEGPWERPYGVKTRSASATMDREAATAGMRMRRGVERNLSLESGTIAAPASIRSSKSSSSSGRTNVRRPHTSGGMPSDDAALGSLITQGNHHHRSHSAAPPTIDIEASTPISPATLLSELSATPVQTYNSHQRSATLTVDKPPLPPSLPPPIVRSRTPDPESDTSRDNNGAELCRVLTAPPQETFNDLLPDAAKDGDRPRRIARANKLAKMGFVGPGESAAGGVKTKSHTQRLGGGFRSLMQTLKGKS